MKDECLICRAPLEYLRREEPMECAICHRREQSRTRCVEGHYVCSECHTRGMDSILGLCLSEDSCDPLEILEKLMSLPFCHMHGPEHHIMVGCALLTAYRNSGGELDLLPVLKEMVARGKKVPGGACGFWGACGAAVSTGMFMSIITGANPLANEAWGYSNIMTSKSLQKIGEIGGPRCCKRNSYLAILSAIDYAEAVTGVRMSKEQIVCRHTHANNQCIGLRCPFHPENN